MKKKEKINRRSGHRGYWLLGSLITALIAAAVVAFVFSSSNGAAASEPTIPAGVTLRSWSENGHGGQYVLQLLDGNAPEAGTEASGVVLSDADCQPDAQDLNHCHNVIRLANGTRITVINNHQMRRHRCLRRGDAVSLTRINASWVMAKLQ